VTPIISVLLEIHIVTLRFVLGWYGISFYKLLALISNTTPYL
jgi:hypothetical protein